MNLLVFNLFVVLIEAAFIFQSGVQHNKKKYLILIFVQLFVLHAFLDPYRMVDLPGYIESFQLFATHTLKYSIFEGYIGVKMEVGWIVLCKLLSYLSNDYIWMLLVSSFVIVGAYCMSIYKYSTCVWLSVFIWLCSNFDQSLFVLRQHTAMAICLLSIGTIIDRKLVRYLLLMSLAVSIHTTALVFVPMYFLFSIKISKKIVFYLLIVTLMAIYYSSSIFGWRFENTWYNSYEEQDASNYTGFIMIFSSFALYIYSIKSKFEDITPAEKLFFLMTCIGMSLALMGVGFSPTNRLLRYYGMASVFLIPISLNHINETKIRVMVTIAVMVFYTMLFFSTSNMMYIENYQLKLFDL